MAGARLLLRESCILVHPLAQNVGGRGPAKRWYAGLPTSAGLVARPNPNRPAGRALRKVGTRDRGLFYVRSDASRRPRSELLRSRGRAPFLPSPEGAQTKTRLQAIAGPLLRKLTGQKNAQQEAQLEELLEDLNAKIKDVNKQLKSIGPKEHNEHLQLLNPVAIPPDLVRKKSENELTRGYPEEVGPSALTTLLVDYSMLVASMWTLNGTIKQALEQQVPAAVSSISQPALDAVKSVGPPVVKYIGEPAMVAARFTGIPQGIGHVSKLIRSTPDHQSRLGSRSKRRLSGLATASRADRQVALEEDETDGLSAEQEAAESFEPNSSWWKGTLGSWEPLRWWSSGEGANGAEEKASAVQQDPLIWPRLSQEASTSGRVEANGAPDSAVEAAVTAAGEGFLGTKIASAQEQPDEAEGWDGKQKGEDPREPLGFSFSAAGLLFPYHLGVCQALMDAGLLTDKTPLAGSSAGAIVSAALGAGVTPLEALQMTKDLAKDCRKNGTAGRLGAVLRGILQEVLPENCHEMCNGRVRVAVTQLFRWPKGVLVDEFYSKDDVIEALITSSFIPGFLAPAAANVFRDRYCIDGGMTLFMPPTSGRETIRVCAFPASAYGLKDVQISPDCNPEGRVSLRQLLSWALEAPSDGILDDLFRQGQADADVWIRSRESSFDENKEAQLVGA